MTIDAKQHPIQWLAQGPVAVVLGIVCGFAACCAAGRWAATQQPYTSFVRFHPGIAPDSSFYPTYAQTLNLAREHVQPGKVLVIVGGNSVLQGVGQREQEIWTKALATQLGDGFTVVNLAMRGGYPNEVGALIAESLIAENFPVVYVAGAVQDAFGAEWDGAIYRYFFWDGFGKGLVPSDERRDAWLKTEFYTRYAEDDAMLERRRRGLVDGLTYASELWTYLAHQHLSTVWTPLKREKFWQPHAELKDTDPGDTLPKDHFYSPATLPTELKIIRAQFEGGAGQMVLQGQNTDVIKAGFERHLPEKLRKHSLMILRLESSFYRSRLTAEEQALYEQVYQGLARIIESTGVRAQVIGKDYTDYDYRDRSHLGENGGRLLAAEVAPTIREMAGSLYPNLTAKAGGTQP
jgi:hypothetical protein